MYVAKVSHPIRSLWCCKNPDIRLDPEKLKNRQILLVLTVFTCYYWTMQIGLYQFLTIEYGTVLNFWCPTQDRQVLKPTSVQELMLLCVGA